MGSMNRVFLMGNLTRDPELRRTPTGASVLDLGLAVSDVHRSKDGQTVESTCFTDVVVWGQQAEHCQQYLAKGSPVIVEGRLQLDRWKTAEGQNRSRLRVLAQRVQFLGRGQSAPEEGAGGEEAVPRPPSNAVKPALCGTRRG